MDFEFGSLQFYKLLHIFGAIMLVGNITVTAVWKTLANYTEEPKIVAYAQRLVTITDVVFTFGGVVLILISGYIMAESFGGIHGTSWLTAAMSIFSASAVIWVVILIPVQMAQSRMARDFRDGGPIPPRYWVLSKIWMVAGTLAVILPFAVLYFMVVKP